MLLEITLKIQHFIHRVYLSINGCGKGKVILLHFHCHRRSKTYSSSNSVVVVVGLNISLSRGVTTRQRIYTQGMCVRSGNE